jgi:spermidine synthase
VEKEDRVLEAVVLDNLIHSYVDLKDPLHLQYAYEKIKAELVAWRAASNPQFRALIIGGGGYTFPRYLEVKYPQARIEVIEIDPRLTQISSQYLGLSSQTRIRTFNDDARWILMNFPEKGVYDFIFGDAYNDLSIPYHLTTKEFSDMLRSLLKPDGILVANIIDHFERGIFLPSYVRTLQEVFGKEKVALIADAEFDRLGINTNIVAVSSADHPWKDVEKISGGRCFVMSPQGVNESFKKRTGVIITDDYAPVDNLIAPIFEERFGRQKTG